MTDQQRKNYGWSLAVALLGSIVTLAGLGYTSLQSAMHRMEDYHDEIQDTLESIKISVAVFESSNFNSSDGADAWKAIAELNSRVDNLPPTETQKEIDENKRRIDRLFMLVERISAESNRPTSIQR